MELKSFDLCNYDQRPAKLFSFEVSCTYVIISSLNNMAIPEDEISRHSEWIESLERIPQKKCLVTPDHDCIRPKIRESFLAVYIPIFEDKLSNPRLFHAFRPRICQGCPVSAESIRDRYNTTPR